MFIGANFVACFKRSNKPLDMKLDAIVKHGNGRAHFKIRRENPGIYYASLVKYDGSWQFKPPEEITLVRGVRQWTGSHEDETLLSQLGKVIEEAYSKPSVT